MTGLENAAKKRVGGFSLGMGQRLGIAAALLGDPATLILDEPVNGLDPEGVRWVRTLARQLADDGRTVFISSHLMSEMAQTADHLLIIGRGRIITAGPIREVIATATQPAVRVVTPRFRELTDVLTAAGATVSTTADGVLDVTDLSSAEIGDLAARLGVPLHELSPHRASLEDAYMTLTQNDVEYRSGSSSKGAGR
ncbi:ABC transporter-like protein [Mycobacteroides abscessus subsp. abscessus]|nr:ABC transporter-like protein [Mycobacteroides abscessus subsp. abscessus]